MRSLGMRCHSRQAMNSPGIVVQVLQQVRERLARRLLHREHLDERGRRPAGGRGGTRRPSRRRSSPGACRACSARGVDHGRRRSSRARGRTGTPRRFARRVGPKSAIWTSKASALWCSVPMARSSSASSSCSARRSTATRGAPRAGARQTPLKPRAAPARRAAPRRAAPGTARARTGRRGGRSDRPCGAESPRARPAAAQACGDERADRPLDEVLVDAAVLVQQPQRRPRSGARWPGAAACVSPS